MQGPRCRKILHLQPPMQSNNDLFAKKDEQETAQVEKPPMEIPPLRIQGPS